MKTIGIMLNIAFLLSISAMLYSHDNVIIILTGISSTICKICDFTLYYQLYKQ